jgi:hypothetical protein
MKQENIAADSALLMLWMLGIGGSLHRDALRLPAMSNTIG